MGTWGLVKSEFGASGVLDFKSAVSGDSLLQFDGTNDLVTVGSGASLLTAGPRLFTLTKTDIDAQNGTLTAAAIAGGLIVHTSVTGGGTLTFDTAAAIVAAIPALNTAGRAYRFTIINDGDQTVTLASDGGTTVTMGDAGNTILINEAADIILLCTAAGALTAYTVGA